MTSIVSGASVSFSLKSVGGTWSWRTVATNSPGIGQLYEVTDINTPFGPIFTVASPIPGDVVSAMASSVVELQQQLYPYISVTGPTSFSITVTENDPTIQIGTIPFTNTGAFGSYLTATAIPSASWMSVTPSTVVGVGKNGSGQFLAYVKPSLMVYTSSPYTGVLNIQDNSSPPNVVPINLTVNVNPRPSISVSPTLVSLSWYLSSSSSYGPQIVTITNSGPVSSSLTMSVAKLLNVSPWLVFNPTSAGPIPSSSTVNVTFSLDNNYIPSIPGIYSETVRISSPNATNSPTDITVELTVNP